MALSRACAALAESTYQPQPVKRVEIPKPDSGIRKLGVPCVVDRLIQQAMLQVLQGRWDPTFSEHSYGFRPGRSTHQAVAQAQRYIADGYNVVVDLDLEKFFVRNDVSLPRTANVCARRRLERRFYYQPLLRCAGEWGNPLRLAASLRVGAAEV
jgi:retron-type reverse transcriptase